MAEMFVIKGQMIAMNPNNEEWAKWVNSQKRVDNLTNDDGELRPKSELEALFQRYKEKHQVKSTPIESPNILRLISENNDISELNRIKSTIDERISYLLDKEIREKSDETKKNLQYLKDKGYDINSILEQFI